MTVHRRPIVAVTSDVQRVGDQRRYTADAIPVDTVARTLDAVPLVVPAIGSRLDLPSLLVRVDGVMVTGGLTNVHPARYGRQASPEDGPFDPDRDATALPLIKATLARGVPMLLTCRGFQELNVALGGTLARENSVCAEADKHGTPSSAQTDDERYRIRQRIRVLPGGLLARQLEAAETCVNSLHSQIIEGLAPGLRPEAIAEDGTVEAASVIDAPGYALGVVFHPEYWAEQDRTSYAILESFRRAVRAHADRSSLAASMESHVA